MILEWMEVGESWDDESDVITFEMGKIVTDALGEIGSLINTKKGFHYSKDSGGGSSTGLVVNKYGEAWIVWEVEDDS